MDTILKAEGQAFETPTLRINDVFDFRYNEAETKKRFEPYHCFDGQLVVRQSNNGNLYLEDTYWCSGDNYTFTLEKAIEQGVLTFKCNLNDIRNISEHETVYYNDEDIFDLSTQHHCRKQYAIAKTTVRSPEKMARVIKQRISDNENKIRYAQSDINGLRDRLEKLLNGDTSIYI